MAFVVNQSKVNAWRRCHQEYHYRYVQELVPRVTERPFMFGNIVHRMIEESAQGNDPMKVLDQINLDNERLFTAEKEMYGNIIEDIRTIMSEYFAYWQPRDLRFVAVEDETGEERFAEHEFAIELIKGVVFKGQIDVLGITPNKLRWLVEHKTHKQDTPSDDHRWRNLQSVVYIYAIEKMGWLKHVDGVCWNYIKSKPPTVPQLLKSGRLSTRDIVTLPSVVMATLKQHGLSPKDHEDLINSAMETRRDYFQRIFTPVNTTIFGNIFDGFLESAKEMRQYHGKKRDKNLGRHCDWCKYESLCRAELTGGDVDFVREREFVHEEENSHHRSKRKLQVIG